MSLINKSFINKYKKEGFCYGIPIFSKSETKSIRSEIEALEKKFKNGISKKKLDQFFRVNGHFVIPLLANLSRTSKILDYIELLLGSNILVWSVELFIKEPGSSKIVSWHQDLTYWGMGETDKEVTAWIALSNVNIESGCMRFIPKSHNKKILKHEDTFDKDNLLSRGQEIKGINEEDAIYAPLKPGEMSLHHGKCLHASGKNNSKDRRIGLAIRYVTPDVRNKENGHDFAMLVRGFDDIGGWFNFAGPRGLFNKKDLNFYNYVLKYQSKVLMAGANKNEGMYKADM